VLGGETRAVSSEVVSGAPGAAAVLPAWLPPGALPNLHVGQRSRPLLAVKPVRLGCPNHLHINLKRRPTGIAREMALVPATRAADAPPVGPLVLYDGSDSLGPPLEQKLARLRGDREAHSRKQIWTKDAHGGPYRKVMAGWKQWVHLCKQGGRPDGHPARRPAPPPPPPLTAAACRFWRSAVRAWPDPLCLNGCQHAGE
jgi:hypothetical protein